jgi:hypothetical protein
MSKTVIWTWPGKIRVVEAERTNASPREGERQNWSEYQVVHGRRVVSRHDTRKQAYAAAVSYVETTP